jgi:hypothetical protein
MQTRQNRRVFRSLHNFSKVPGREEHGGAIGARVKPAGPNFEISITYLRQNAIELFLMASRVLRLLMLSAARRRSEPTCFGFPQAVFNPLGRGPTGRTPHC